MCVCVCRDTKRSHVARRNESWHTHIMWVVAHTHWLCCVELSNVWPFASCVYVCVLTRKWVMLHVEMTHGTQYTSCESWHTHIIWVGTHTHIIRAVWSCQTCDRLHDACIRVSYVCHTCVIRVSCVCHVSRTNATGVVGRCVVLSDPTYAYDRLHEPIMSNGIYMNGSWDIYEWVMAYIWMNRGISARPYPSCKNIGRAAAKRFSTMSPRATRVTFAPERRSCSYNFSLLFHFFINFFPLIFHFSSLVGPSQFPLSLSLLFSLRGGARFGDDLAAWICFLFNLFINFFLNLSPLFSPFFLFPLFFFFFLLLISVAERDFTKTIVSARPPKLKGKEKKTRKKQGKKWKWKKIVTQTQG